MTSAERAALVLAERIAGILGDTLASVVLHGSLAAGDFRPHRSDIDLLVVVTEPLPGTAALQHLARTAGLGSAAGLDLHVVTTDTARSPSPAPPLELHLGRYGTADPEVELRTPAAPDLPAELSMARAGGRALLGAAPHEVIAPVPAAWVVARGRHWLTTWLSRADDAEHAVFMALTACRMWRFAAEHVHATKSAAARWALARDPSLTAVRQALRRHEGDGTAVVGERELAALLARVLREDFRPPDATGSR